MRVNLTRGSDTDKKIVSTSKLVGACVRCGMCISSCPSYLVTGDERHSPRGRIYLIKQILEANSKNNSNSDLGLGEYFETCLTCLSCETACPSNVIYSEIIDYARSLSKDNRSNILQNYIKSVKYKLIIDLIITGKLFVKVVKLLNLFFFVSKPILFGKLITYYNLLPKVNSAKFIKQIKLTKINSKIILFSGCVEVALDARIANAITNIMSKLNIEIIYLKQSCCGALHHHNGFDKQAKTQQQKFKQTLRESLIEHNITKSDIIYSVSGCGKQLLSSNLNNCDQDSSTKTNTKDYDLSLFEAGEWFYHNISKLKKIIKPDKLNEIAKKRIVFHPPCSITHSIKKLEDNLNLLNDIGFNFSIPENYNICCGAAGIYNLSQIDIADELRSKKIMSISAFKPDIVISSNLACLLQIDNNKKNDSPIEYLHMAELIEKLI